MSTSGRQHDQDEWLTRRKQMVEQQVRRRRIRDERVLAAMLKVPREMFVPDSVRASAYEDRALPIDHRQTISQPYIVAYMTEQLEVTPSARVLEIGTGTGYQTAILAQLAEHVYSVERIAALQERAAANLAELGVTNVTLSLGDGSMGLEMHAPFDRIMVTAAAPKIPTPLTRQLVDGGVLVIPIGSNDEQTLIRVVRKGSRTMETPTLACRFVKLIGRQGWNAHPHG